MREEYGRKGRVSNKVKAALLAMLAVFAISGFTATQASAAQQLKLSFDDSWIGLPALAGLGAGGFHALDPTDGKNLKIDLTGDLAADGTFTAPASAFAFPTQVIDAGAPIGNINLDIVSSQDITGNYNRTTGAFNANLSLRLEIVAAALSLNCQLSPLNIPLATSGSYSFPDPDADPPADIAKSGTPFASGSGAVMGAWTNVTADNVTQVPPPEDPAADLCKTVIGGIIANADPGNPNPSFDGTIWLGGTAAVTGEPDNPNPPVATPGKVGKITAAKKGKVKKGKAVTIKVKVTNTGGKVLTGKLAIKSSNKQVKAPKSAKLKVQPGKTQTIKVKVKASKKAKGKAKITFSAGGKKAVTTLTVKK